MHRGREIHPLMAQEAQCGFGDGGALKWSNVARSHRRGPRVNRSSPSLTKGKRGMKSERVTGCDNKSDHSAVFVMPLRVKTDELSDPAGARCCISPIKKPFFLNTRVKVYPSVTDM